MLGTIDVICESIFRIVCLVACCTCFLECGSLSLDAVCGLDVQDLFGKDFRGKRGEGGDAAFEIIATVRVRRRPKTGRGGEGEGNSLPIRMHMTSLLLRASECYLAGVAGEGMSREKCCCGGGLIGSGGPGGSGGS